VVGAFPLVIATGAGAEARLALGWIIIGGLGFATVFTLLLVPVAYRILAPLAKPRAHETQILIEELQATSKAHETAVPMN
jgi:HAE1 family hydrophobic/amphiphilic exporter-1